MSAPRLHIAPLILSASLSFWSVACEKIDDSSLGVLHEAGYAFRIDEFFRAVESGEDEVVAAFLEIGTDPGIEDSAGRLALPLAAAGGHDLVVAALTAAGADPNQASVDGIPALSLGVRDFRVVDILLKAGADPLKIDPDGHPPLIHAIRNGSEKSFELLCRMPGVDKQQALFVAAEIGNVKIIDHLLNNGAEIDHAIHDGATPLIMATQWKNVIAVRLFLSRGARADLRDNYGKSALDYARDSKDAGLLKVFGFPPTD